MTSILPSSDPSILKKMNGKNCQYQVIKLHDCAEHALVRHSNGYCGVVCTHDNGYSCHELGKRILAGDVIEAQYQAKYIMRCGGTSRGIDVIEILATGETHD
jgi:hypothetical protein